jgi:predicted ArsR family transcriptional regulator
MRGVSWLEVLGVPGRLAVVRGLCESVEATTAQLSHRSHISEPVLRRHLAELEAMGVVRSQARPGLPAPGRPALLFSVHPDLREEARSLLEALTAPVGSGAGRTRGPKPGR